MPSEEVCRHRVLPHAPPWQAAVLQLADVSCLCFRISGNGQRAWGVVHKITAFCLGKPGAAAPVSRRLEEVLGPGSLHPSPARPTRHRPHPAVLLLDISPEPRRDLGGGTRAGSGLVL